MKYAYLLLFLPCLLACRQNNDTGVLPTENAVYYWRTTWSIDSVESEFLRQHDIKIVFCRYFDVVMNDTAPMPNATIRFNEPVADGITIVPTVYITEDCMSSGLAQDPGRTDGASASVLARRIVDRVVQINATNDLPPARELQVDCDYTQRSRQTYYDFLSLVREEARNHGMSLSTTIRLHQLSMPAPPADYGVLMVYNTGDPRHFTERNPILDLRDVKPYLSRLPGYALPLAAAYPVYMWQRNIYGVRIEHTVDAKTITDAKKMVEEARPDMRHTIITFHLDKENINRYSYETYNEIYRH